MGRTAIGDAAECAMPMTKPLQRWMPGLVTLLNYRREWFRHDLVAGLALIAILIPVGMGYAEASGLPAIQGLYATILPLVAYALFGPSRILVLGPDSTMAAVIAAIILPLSGGSVERAVALAGMLAVLSGGWCLLIGLARLGLVADLLSKPIRIGFLNAIALTVLVGQLPKLFGFPVAADNLIERALGLVRGIAQGQTQPVSLLIGASSLALIVLLKRYRRNWPGILLAMLLALAVSAALNLKQTAALSVVGALPPGLPGLIWPSVSVADALQLLPGALIIATLAFAETSVLSRALALRGGYSVSQNQEMVAMGMANAASGLFQGFPISSSASRTPVAQSAGAKTQVTGLVGALAIALLLMLAPGLLTDLPTTALAAVVITACLSFSDLAGMWALWRLRRVEFVLSMTSFLGVAFVGVIQGIFVTLALAVAVLVWNAWHPYFAQLVRVDGRKGYHDAQRHPEGRRVPGLVLFRWDAQLFFANAELFREQVLLAAAQALTATQRVVIVADAITDIDVTAADMLAALHGDLQRQHVELQFAGLKGGVRDRLAHYGTLAVLGRDIFWPTVGSAVDRHLADHQVVWKDWDEA